MTTQTPPQRAMATPSPWVERFVPLIHASGSVLDLACGNGRHTRLLLRRGFHVTAVDRDVSGLRDLRGHPRLDVVQADLETGPWPLGRTEYAGVVVVNYLWRPLLGMIVGAVAAAGVLIYDTFAQGQEQFGKPANPDHLLRRGELLGAVRGKLRVVACEHGHAGIHPSMRSRICARRDA